MAITLNGDGLIQVDGTSTTQGRVRLNEDSDNGTNYVELQAAASLAANVTFTLPDADGTNGQVIQTNGAGALSFTTISSGGDYIMQVFTTPGTWTKPVGLKAVKITVVGGGGGGGGALGNPSLNSGGGGGGGAGSAIEYLDAPLIPGPVSVTAGTGGTGGAGTGPAPSGTGGTGNTSSFGSFCSATGGAGGTRNGSPISPGSVGAAGAGGTGSGGTFNVTGGAGIQHYNEGVGGAGGNTIYAGNPGINSTNPGGPSNGSTGNVYGAGGSGARCPVDQSATGGAGGAGIVIVEEFY